MRIHQLYGYASIACVDTRWTNILRTIKSWYAIKAATGVLCNFHNVIDNSGKLHTSGQYYQVLIKQAFMYTRCIFVEFRYEYKYQFIIW